MKIRGCHTYCHIGRSILSICDAYGFHDALVGGHSAIALHEIDRPRSILGTLRRNDSTTLMSWRWDAGSLPDAPVMKNAIFDGILKHSFKANEDKHFRVICDEQGPTVIIDRKSGEEIWYRAVELAKVKTNLAAHWRGRPERTSEHESFGLYVMSHGDWNLTLVRYPEDAPDKRYQLFLTHDYATPWAFLRFQRGPEWASFCKFFPSAVWENGTPVIMGPSDVGKFTEACRWVRGRMMADYRLDS